MGISFDHVEVEHDAICGGQVFYQCDQFFIQDRIVGRLSIVFMFPYMLGDGIALGIVHFPPHIVDSRVDDHPSYPADEEHFHFFLVAHFETAEIPEHLQKGIMSHFCSLLVGINIPEGDLETQAIVLIVQQFLALPVLLGATCDYMK